MTLFYYNSHGDAIAWRRDENDPFLFNGAADPIGWFPWDDEDAYTMDGEYLGTVVDDERLLRRTFQPYRGYPGSPGTVGYVGYAGFARSLGHLGYRLGFEDVPQHLLEGDPDDDTSSTDLINTNYDGRAAAQATGLMLGAAALIGSVAALTHLTDRRKERRAREQAELAALNPAPTTAPAGWYPNQGTLRFWDGTRWTHHIAPVGSMPPPVNYVDRRPPASGFLAVTAWMVALMTMGYMVPWAIAVSRRTTNQAQVGLVNFLLGWTIAGWFVALVMEVRPNPTCSAVPW